MRIEAFAICYNEEKLLPYYLRHYLAFCDKITIYDNHSTDQSREICARFPQVEVKLYESGGQIRDDIYLSIKNNCWQWNADGSRKQWAQDDWVVVGDIDELVYHPDIRNTLAATKATAIAPALFNMFSKDFPTTEGQIWEEVQFGLQGGAKMNLFRPAAITDTNYEPGCHEANPKGTVIFDDGTGIKTLHMKYLGKEYYIQRTEMSNKRLSDINKRYGWGRHYTKTVKELARTFDGQIKEVSRVL